ncbi:aminoacyl-tRNA hydrolase [Nocardioides pakistanensis]
MSHTPSTATARGKGEHSWVQPIVVAKEGTHENTVLAGAQASVGLYLSPNHTAADDRFAHAFHAWLSGPFTKTVRRASYKDLAKVVDWCEEHRVPYEGVEYGDSAAFALPPMRYVDLPKPVARLQVSGTDLPRRPGVAHRADDEDSWVTLHVDETLTTGKATAQDAHAMWAWVLDWTRHAGPWEIEKFFDVGWPTDLNLTTAASLARIADEPYTFPIRDNGLTEVDPGTLTAVAEGWHATRRTR